jgi:hypothetical protein
MLAGNSLYDKSINRRLKLVVLCILIILNISYSAVSAQRTREEAPPFKERLFYGGSFGLMLGTLTDIDLSPVIGLWLLPRLNVAIGPKYRYYKYYDDRANIYGGRIYTQFAFVKDLDNIIPAGIHLGLFLHAEDEFFSLNYTAGNVNGATGSYFINTPLVGAGISQPTGRRSSLNLMFLFALDDYYDLYADPEIRISFTF